MKKILMSALLTMIAGSAQAADEVLCSLSHTVEGKTIVRKDFTGSLPVHVIGNEMIKDSFVVNGEFFDLRIYIHLDASITITYQNYNGGNPEHLMVDGQMGKLSPTMLYSVRDGTAIAISCRLK